MRERERRRETERERDRERERRDMKRLKHSKTGANSQQDYSALANAKPGQIRQKINGVIHKEPHKG